MEVAKNNLRLSDEDSTELWKNRLLNHSLNQKSLNNLFVVLSFLILTLSEKKQDIEMDSQKIMRLSSGCLRSSLMI